MPVGAGAGRGLRRLSALRLLPTPAPLLPPTPQELLACYALIEKQGRGVVYYGSARLKQDSPHWGRAVELGRDVAALLGCTTWSGGGPGMMQAATEGALAAGRPVAGIRIQREAGTTVLVASYLPSGSQTFCRYLSSRKVALVDAGEAAGGGVPGAAGGCAAAMHGHGAGVPRLPSPCLRPPPLQACA